ncbi:MAG: hypothetical protein ACKVZ0_17770 [Gemmatimonadales bacterium]
MTAGAVVPTRDFVSGQVASFLAHLAVGIHKLRAYPVGHPMRQVAVEAAFRTLGGFLAAEPTFRIGVGQGQFVVADAVTDPDHFVIRDLAARLHRRQVGAVVFHAGLTVADFTAALEALAIEPARNVIATVDPFPVSPTPTVEFTAIAFDALGLCDGDVGLQLDRLWQDLAQLVAGDAGDGSVGGLGNGLDVAGDGTGSGAGVVGGADHGPYGRLLADRFAQPEVRAALSAALERYGRLAQSLDGEARVDAEARLADLLATIPKSALTKVLEVSLNDPAGRARLVPTSEWLPTLALVELVEAAATDQGQKFSAVFLRLLRKLSGHGAGSAARRPAGERDLRLLVKALVEDWTLADPNSKAHAHILDTLARQDLVSPAEGAPTAEGLRVLHIALETEAVGEALAEALEQVLLTGTVGDLVRSLMDTPEPNRAAEELWRQLVAPVHLRRILNDDRVDIEVVRHLLTRVGLDGVDLLLARLLSIPNHDVQREVAEHVLSLGAQASLALLQRLERSTSEDRRQLLHILSLVKDLPPAFSARAYLDAPEPLVRLEAIRLMVRRPEDRDEALYHALADEDERVARFGLQAGLDQMPRHCLSRLMQLLNSPRRSPELKAQAIPVLARFDTPAIREWLVGGMVVRRGWFRRRRLAPKSRIVLAKLTVLAGRWAEHPDVARVLELARRSGDGELAAAATPGGVG